MKPRAPRNRTLTCTSDERSSLERRLLRLDSSCSVDFVTNRILNQDFFCAIPFLPHGFVNLLVIDPPYNLSKDYNGNRFKEVLQKAHFMIKCTSGIQFLFSRIRTITEIRIPNRKQYTHHSGDHVYLAFNSQ